MKNNYILLFALVGVLGFFTSCEKDGETIVLPENVIAPKITTMPDLTLIRDNGANDVVFNCSETDPGFSASVNYFLEACPAGNNFQEITELYSGITCKEIKFTVSELNNILLNGFPEDATTSVDFRIRSVLEADAGFGVDDLVYTSETVTADITIFGLLRLDILVTGATGKQKIVSPESNGDYSGYVKLNAGDSFTLLDPDKNIAYGATGTTLAVDGDAISITDAGWYKVSANTIDLTFENLRYLVGIVGVVNGWSAPDLVMEYDQQGKYWFRNSVALPDGGMKFRHNEDWSNDFNFGVLDNTVTLDFDNISLVNAGDSQDIIMTAGTYDVKLWIDLEGNSKCSILPSAL